MFLLAGASQVNAGVLCTEFIGCPGGYKFFLLHWIGPWSQPLIYLAQQQPGGPEVFYMGYLQESGTAYGPPRNKIYYMYGCTGQLCEILASEFVPFELCGDDQPD